jgi:hypothetical protein
VYSTSAGVVRNGYMHEKVRAREGGSSSGGTTREAAGPAAPGARSRRRGGRSPVRREGGTLTAPGYDGRVTPPAPECAWRGNLPARGARVRRRATLLRHSRESAASRKVGGRDGNIFEIRTVELQNLLYK